LKAHPRIYIVTPTFLPSVGGAEKQAFAQSHSLRERGYETTIVTFRRKRTWLRHELIEGVPVIRVAGMLLEGREKLPRPLQKLLYLVAMLVMGWTLWRRRQRYDILHVYKLSVLTLPVALVCRLAGKRMLVAVRSADSDKATSSHSKASLLAGPLDPTTPWLQVDERLQATGRVKANSDLEVLAAMGKPVVRFLSSLLYRTHAVVVVLSSRMKSSLAKHGFNVPDVELIPNGVDITRFNPAQVDSSSDGREQVVICVSGLRYEKGVDVLLQAWHLVQQQAPQARLIIVGAGSLQFQLECMAKALDIATSVEFTGLQTDVPAQLHRGGLAVLPSRWEGMPNALLEAMACGLPCVATRVSGSEDIIQHGVNGLLVEPEDYQGMAQALLTLLRDPVLTRKYGQTARKTVERYYSLERIMDKYVELYHKITDGRWQVVEDTPTSKTYHLSS
jgi:glycosyltransferase involved in cell wall biosynthesis